MAETAWDNCSVCNKDLFFDEETGNKSFRQVCDGNLFVCDECWEQGKTICEECRETIDSQKAFEVMSVFGHGIGEGLEAHLCEECALNIVISTLLPEDKREGDAVFHFHSDIHNMYSFIDAGTYDVSDHAHYVINKDIYDDLVLRLKQCNKVRV